MTIQRAKTQLALVGVVALGLGLTPNAWSYCGDPQCVLSSCTTGSIGNPGTLSKTNETICVGGSVSAPSVSGTTTNNGSKQVLCWDNCQSWYNYYPIYYRLTNWFEPAIPSTFTNGGTFVFTNKVQGLSTDAVCPSATAVVTVGTFTVTVNVAPTITGQPTNQTVCQGENAAFCVTASGSAPLSYQWRFNGTNLAGATGSCYTKTNVQPGDAGSYSVAVANPWGSALSSGAELTVVDPTLDSDGDGWSYLQEYQNGTNPAVIDVPLKVRITMPAANSIIP